MQTSTKEKLDNGEKRKNKPIEEVERHSLKKAHINQEVKKKLTKKGWFKNHPLVDEFFRFFKIPWHYCGKTKKIFHILGWKVLISVISLDKLHHSHGSSIAYAKATFKHPKVATRPLFKSRCNTSKELTNGFFTTQTTKS
jgi:hypothetical protein